MSGRIGRGGERARVIIVSVDSSATTMTPKKKDTTTNKPYSSHTCRCVYVITWAIVHFLHGCCVALCWCLPSLRRQRPTRRVETVTASVGYHPPSPPCSPPPSHILLRPGVVAFDMTHSSCLRSLAFLSSQHTRKRVISAAKTSVALPDHLEWSIAMPGYEPMYHNPDLPSTSLSTGVSRRVYRLITRNTRRKSSSHRIHPTRPLLDGALLRSIHDVASHALSIARTAGCPDGLVLSQAQFTHTETDTFTTRGWHVDKEWWGDLVVTVTLNGSCDVTVGPKRRPALRVGFPQNPLSAYCLFGPGILEPCGHEITSRAPGRFSLTLRFLPAID